MYEEIIAEIERLKERANAERVLHPKTILSAKNFLLIQDYDNLLKFIKARQQPSEDLEEAAVKYQENAANLAARYPTPYEQETGICPPSWDDAFIAGAQWQKEQMMKGAVDTVVGIEDWGHLIVKVDNLGLNYRDKVKIIIVKED